MNGDLMSQYIEFVADRLLGALGYWKMYGAGNPFDWEILWDDIQVGCPRNFRLAFVMNSGTLYIWCIWYFAIGLVNGVESFLISNGFLKKYKDLDISKVRYLAVVIDSEEALQTLKVLELLRSLAAIGLKNECWRDPRKPSHYVRLDGAD